MLNCKLVRRIYCNIEGGIRLSSLCSVFHNSGEIWSRSFAICNEQCVCTIRVEGLLLLHLVGFGRRKDCKILCSCAMFAVP
jgi:hypothetical protein